jgi:hypothetical protein
MHDIFYENDPLEGIRKIAEGTKRVDQREGTILSAQPGNVLVQFDGSSAAVPVEVMRGLTVHANDRATLVRSKALNRWVVYGSYPVMAINGDINSPSSADGGGPALGAPGELTATGYENCIVLQWEPPGARSDAVFEVEVSDDSAGTDPDEYRIAGSNFILFVEGSVTKYFRVRSVGKNWARSGWTTRVSGTSVDPHTILDDILTFEGDVLSFDGNVLWATF